MREMIESGTLRRGDRLPATRELAGQLGLNRTTVSAAYSLLETEGLIAGHVGRGSFVTGRAEVDGARRAASAGFSRSRPSESLFPLDEFRKTCAEVISDREIAADSAARLARRLRAPAPLPARQARDEGVARESDDILITNGCQQAFDLLQRVVRRSRRVLIEDPVYPGLRKVFERAGARAHRHSGRRGRHRSGRPRTRHRARASAPALVTPNFQNPTGATLPLAARQSLLRIAQAAGVP